jgi:uncharacterized protein (TIGR03083 family)
VLNLLRDLDAHDWSQLTDCAPWTVRDIVAHLIGAAEATASTREQLRQQREGKALQGDGERMAAVNALQISERRDRSNDELVNMLADAATRGIKTRSALPAPVRMTRLRLPAPLGWASLNYLNGRIYTRDVWMHRIDITRATGREMVLTAEHDGRIIADLIEEWGAGRQLDLALTGPAGGRFGTGASHCHDAVDFCRALAGRGTIPGVEPAVVLF